jgi:DNA repair exonuclease SbcCD ATPase subunit
MSSDYDASEFVDRDLETGKSAQSAALRGTTLHRAPTREEVDTRVIEAQQKLAELKRAQEDLERERAALEETRRRQMEFQAGRQELTQHMTRGIGLLEEAELEARRQAEELAKTLADFKTSLQKIGSIQEESWNKDNFQVELTRALTTLENARMEWNAARLKFEVLSKPVTENPETHPAHQSVPVGVLAGHSFGDLCRLGFALTWPIVLAVLVVGAVLLVVLLRS